MAHIGPLAVGPDGLSVLWPSVVSVCLVRGVAIGKIGISIGILISVGPASDCDG